MIQPSLVQATSVNSMSIIITTKVCDPIVPIHTEQKDIQYCSAICGDDSRHDSCWSRPSTSKLGRDKRTQSKRQGKNASYPRNPSWGFFLLHRSPLPPTLTPLSNADFFFMDAMFLKDQPLFICFPFNERDCNTIRTKFLSISCFKSLLCFLYKVERR
jgi:hypothetical protein